MSTSGDVPTTEYLEKEIVPFLTRQYGGKTEEVIEQTLRIAADYLLGLSGSPQGARLISSSKKVLSALADLCADKASEVSRMAYQILVNLTADDPNVAQHLLSSSLFLSHVVARCTDPQTSDDGQGSSAEVSDLACMLLSNLSREESCASSIATWMEEGGGSSEGAEKKEGVIYRVVSCLCKVLSCRHHLASFLANITQVKRVRCELLDRKKCVMERIIPFISFESSIIRRKGIVAAIRNCSFETDSHDWLLGERIDLLPRLLLPLAGPEEFDEEEMEKLPVDLQYLPADKEREDDPDVRRMLVETINQLCATQKGREFVRSCNTYVVLREYHKWEKDEDGVTALENLVAVLISDEPEQGMEDLNTVEIPSTVQESLDKADRIIAEQKLQSINTDKKDSN